MAETQWYFVEDDQRAGPVDETELAEMAQHRVIAPDTLVWTDGMKDWEAASAHFEFAGPSDPPPPVPARAQAPAAAVDDMDFPLTSVGHRPGEAVLGTGIGGDGLYVGAPSRSFGGAISTVFSKYATFSGRASRSEYWYYSLFIFLCNFVIGLFAGVGVLAGPIFSLATLLPSLAVTVRRLHDTDRSGWWVGIGLLVFVVAGALLAGMSGGYVGDGVNIDGEIMLMVGLGILAAVYSILMFVFMCLKGTPGPNRFG